MMCSGIVLNKHFPTMNHLTPYHSKQATINSQYLHLNVVVLSFSMKRLYIIRFFTLLLLAFFFLPSSLGAKFGEYLVKNPDSTAILSSLERFEESSELNSHPDEITTQNFGFTLNTFIVVFRLSGICNCGESQSSLAENLAMTQGITAIAPLALLVAPPGKSIVGLSTLPGAVSGAPMSIHRFSRVGRSSEAIPSIFPIRS